MRFPILPSSRFYLCSFSASPRRLSYWKALPGSPPSQPRRWASCIWTFSMSSVGATRSADRRRRLARLVSTEVSSHVRPSTVCGRPTKRQSSTVQPDLVEQRLPRFTFCMQIVSTDLHGTRLQVIGVSLGMGLAGYSGACPPAPRGVHPHHKLDCPATGSDYLHGRQPPTILRRVAMRLLGFWSSKGAARSHRSLFPGSSSPTREIVSPPVSIVTSPPKVSN